jgi:hypothetical protein
MTDEYSTDDSLDAPEISPDEFTHLVQTETVQDEITRLRYISMVFDDAIQIPWTNRRFGADVIVGALPIGGDVASSIVSVYIIYKSYTLGAPPLTLLHMIGNVMFDLIVGMIPVVGDLLDVSWKANTRNVALLTRETSHLALRKRSKYHAFAILVTPVLFILLLIVAVVTLAIAALL